MNNSFVKLLNDKGDIRVYKYMEIPDIDPLHEPISYYEEYICNAFDLLKENEKLQEEQDHYKHLYSEVKKQKDDVVEYIKEHLTDNGRFLMLNEWQVPDLLRMLGEIDETDNLQ